MQNTKKRTKPTNTRRTNKSHGHNRKRKSRATIKRIHRNNNLRITRQILRKQNSRHITNIHKTPSKTIQTEPTNNTNQQKQKQNLTQQLQTPNQKKKKKKEKHKTTPT